tara:strand:+ start:1808 stop:2044 length:237 start_codon:yes stop_codon:yes gene_type:complete
MIIIRQGKSCRVIITDKIGTTHPEITPQEAPLLAVGATFNSISEASRLTGIDRCHIIGNLRGRYPHARGYVFEYDTEE